MNTDLLFDFTVDKATKTVCITREFAADLSRVWDAYTKPELLDQWWAPNPMISKTKVMNFEVGGRRFYAMVSPEGQERWAIQRYTSISPKTNFKFFNVFADKDENPEPSGSEWDLNFSEQNGITKVRISIYNESLERLEHLLEGFKAGFTITLKILEDLLTNLSQVDAQIESYITSQPEPKRSEMQTLHQMILQVRPACKLWYFDGKDSEDKVVANPNIGYGLYTIKYANGDTKPWFQVSISANKTGISVYILGIKDKTFLAQTFGEKLGKASVTGYCIRFKKLQDIDLTILEAAIRYGFEHTKEHV